MARGPRFFYFKYQQRFLRPPFTFFLLVFPPPRVSSSLGVLGLATMPSSTGAFQRLNTYIYIPRIEGG